MIEARDGRRVVVTGLGVLAPGGTGPEEFWAALSRPAPAAAVRTVAGFDPGDWGLTRAQARRSDRHAQLATAAAAQALDDAGLADGVPDDPDLTGVIVGSSIGGAHFWERQVLAMRDRGPRAVSPLTVPICMPNAAAAAISERWGLTGPCETVSTACASGTHSIAYAARTVAAGRADRMLAGGAESCQTDTNVAAFTMMRALSPSGVSRPFDVDRDGFCAAEGAAVLVLEEAAVAAARGARVYAEVVGSASTSDAHHLVAPAPGGTGAARCMRLALRDAGVAPDEVAHVNAHGTATPLNDAAEAAALGTVFGVHRPAVTSVKGVTGHPLGAAGAIEAVAVALAYAHRTLPPTMGTARVDPAFDLDVVLAPRPWSGGVALSNSFAFGGHNATLVLRGP